MRALCWSYQLNVTLGFVLLVSLEWYDSIVQKRLGQCELWIIELDNFYSEDLFYISLVGQYEIFRAVLQCFDEVIYFFHCWSSDDAVISVLLCLSSSLYGFPCQHK